MVLCRKCAHLVGVTTLRCPRCGWTLPYYRSRRWKPRLVRVALFSAGKDCPRCGRRTVRHRSPLWFRPVRALAAERASYRECKACGWHGAAFHDGSEAGTASASLRSRSEQTGAGATITDRSTP